MKTEKRIAVDPTTEQRYEIELPTSEAVKQEILKLDYPSNGITIKEATEKLAEKFGLSDEQKAAQTKRGERYLGFFHYEVVGPEFERLLSEGKLKQPEGRGKPYVLSGDVPPPPLLMEILKRFINRLEKKWLKTYFSKLKQILLPFLKTLLLTCLLKWDMAAQEKMPKP